MFSTVSLGVHIQAKNVPLHQNAFFERLSSLGLDIYSLPAVDPLHEVEIGVWKGLFIQLLRLLDATPDAPVNHLNSRYVCLVASLVM